MLGYFLLVLLATQAPATAAAAAPPVAAASPCETPEHHQFDFWVGPWDVYGPKGKMVGHSLIEKVYGCGIRENWKPFNKQTGGSLSIYAPAESRWEQYWIDSSGTRATFTGGWNGTAMVLTGAWQNSPNDKTGPLTRMTYSKNADGSVRQFGEQSADDGKTWKPSFDFIYRPSAGAASAK